jgi:hypothetical protein
MYPTASTTSNAEWVAQEGGRVTSSPPSPPPRASQNGGSTWQERYRQPPSLPQPPLPSIPDRGPFQVFSTVRGLRRMYREKNIEKRMRMNVLSAYREQTVGNRPPNNK